MRLGCFTIASSTRKASYVLALVALASGTIGPVATAGTFVKAIEENNPAIVAVPRGYDATEPDMLKLLVCIDESTPNAEEMQSAVYRAIDTLNKAVAVTGTFSTIGAPEGMYDLESVFLHELGHCATGLDHVNLILAGIVATDFTATLRGPNGVDNINAGIDGIPGSPDDSRTDDVNLHWFNKGVNDPFVVTTPVGDCSMQPACTYSVDIADLPEDHNFTTNANLSVGSLMPYPMFTRSVMFSSPGPRETFRDLTPDDVATMLLSRAGMDGIPGNDDDFELTVRYIGIEDPSEAGACDINVSEVAAIPMGIALCSGGNLTELSNNRWTVATTNDLEITFDLDPGANGNPDQWFYGEQDLLFVNSFESGDLSRWDETVGN